MSTKAKRLRARKRHEYLGGAMRGICEVMRDFGIPRNVAEARLTEALNKGYSPISNASRESQKLTLLCDVCARWFLESEFVDKRGKPKPLSWQRGTGTLRKLVTRVVGPRDALSVIQQLVDRKLIRRTESGDWIPKSRVVAPTTVIEAQVARSAAMVARLMRTVVHNSELRYKGNVLLEVMAQVPRLKARDISAFKQFSKAQGVSFIKTIDDWLESRNLSRNHSANEKTVEAGLVAFAFYHPRA